MVVLVEEVRVSALKGSVRFRSIGSAVQVSVVLLFMFCFLIIKFGEVGLMMELLTDMLLALWYLGSCTPPFCILFKLFRVLGPDKTALHSRQKQVGSCLLSDIVKSKQANKQKTCNK